MQKDNYFISIALEENSVEGAIWGIKDNSADIIALSTPVTYENEETLVSASDECISSCIQNLPPEAQEPSQTVFGVPSYWVADGQIQKHYLDKIKILCSKLSLSPKGFVVFPEAIAHFIKAEKNTPMSAILIGIYSESIDVSLFRLGNLVGTVNVARSVNIIDDVVEGVARFEEKEILPSQFLLYNTHTHDLEDIKQEIIKADWNNQNQNIKFLHTPSVEILDQDSKMAAVSLAGAVELTGGTTKVNYKKDTPQEIEVPTKDTDNFVDPKALGFSMDQDQNRQVTEVRHFMPKKLKLPSINFGLFKSIKSKIKENALFFGLVTLLSLAIFGLVAFWFLPKADVDIIVSPIKIDETRKVVLDTKATNIDISKLIIPAKVVSTSVTDSKTKTATGTKIIGTPAKGSVTFYNVGDSVTIPAGTILVTSNLQFSLDSDIQIASASGAAQPASSKGNITAVAVGADSNLASGAIFSVGNFSPSLIQAKNDSDLTGGSSQEVTAVSQDDISSLETSLLDNLTTTGENSLKENLDTNDYLIENRTTATATSTTTDHEAGDQASTVKVTLTANVQSLKVSKNDIYTLAKEIFKDKIKPGFVLHDDQIDFIFDKDNLEFKINLLPSIDTLQIAKSITGKTTSAARTILSKIAGFKDATIKIRPSISFLQILPHIAKNISITLSAD